MRLRLLKEASVSGKTVFLRADLDVPIKAQSAKLPLRREASKAQSSIIKYDTRLVAALPTIEYLLKHEAKMVVGGHLGRPKGSNHESGSRNKEFSLRPIAQWLSLHCHSEFISGSHSSGFEIPKQVRNDREIVRHDMDKTKVGDFDGWRIADNLFLLENLRFYKGEEKNDSGFAKKLARLADVYVNDAFAASHRKHASIVGVPKLLPSFAGLHLAKEINTLSKVLKNPKRLLVVVVGGKKIDTKIPLIAKMYEIADYVLVGGKIAEESKEFLKIEHKKTKGRKAILLVADLNPEGTGILENSVNNFIEIIDLAKTVIWNGTVGMVVGDDDFGHASRKVANAIIKSKAYSVVGGGDTIEFLRKIGLIEKFSFASTGGGAMLAFLTGEKLPGIEALH